MATMKAESSSSGAAPSGGNSSSGGLSRPAARPGSGSRSDSGGASGSRGAAAAPPAPPSGGSGAGGDAPSLGDYLKFGRLLGDKPQAVQQQLALGATRVVVDDDSADYLQVNGCTLNGRTATHSFGCGCGSRRLLIAGVGEMAKTWPVCRTALAEQPVACGCC